LIANDIFFKNDRFWALEPPFWGQKQASKAPGPCAKILEGPFQGQKGPFKPYLAAFFEHLLFYLNWLAWSDPSLDNAFSIPVTILLSS